MPKSTIGAPSAQQLDRACAERSARNMVTAAFADPACERLHLFTVPDRPGDPTPAGTDAVVSFTRAEADRAIDWTARILAAGWVIFRQAGPPRPPATEHLADDFCA